MDVSNLIVAAEPWQWAGILILAVAMTWVLYGWGKNHPTPRGVLAMLRFVSAALLGFLLLEPMWRTTTETREVPVVPVLIDATSSQWMGPDSLSRRQALQNLAQDVPAWMASQGWNIDLLDFDREVRSLTLPWEPEGMRTDLGGALESVRDRHIHRNVPGVLVVTDGRANRGMDPEHSAAKLDVPYFFIATGDTAEVSDLAIDKVRMNEVAYLGNSFPVEIVAQARGATDMPMRLTLTHGSTTLAETRWTPSGPFASKTWLVTVDASQAGPMTLRASITPETTSEGWAGEVTLTNNRRSATIEVLESRRQILVVAAAPHPDLAALRTSAESNKHQEVNVIWVSELTSGMALPDHDVLVLHHLQPSLVPSPVVEAMGATKALWILGNKDTPWNDWPSSVVGFQLDTEPLTTEAQGQILDNFEAFPLPSSLGTSLGQWPPLACPTGTYNLSPSLQLALCQQVGPVTTTWPLWAVRDGENQRVAVTLGEGLWRWRMREAVTHEGQAVMFDDLVNRTIQYLSSREDIRRLRVDAPERLDEDIRCVMKAEVYDASLSPTMDVDVILALTREGFPPTEHRFVAADRDHRLDLGRLLPGVYTWVASCKQNGENLVDKGQFVVDAVQVEASLLPANHGLLRRMARQSQGEFLGILESPEDLEELASRWEAAAASMSAQDVVHTTNERLPLHHQTWLLALLLFTLTAEWTLRRAGGGF
ncbi:MAG: VWA domain-containing protein [Bacteroidetes bacterium]|nr:VWA domain-containing protein [Bacteroidota bacterium]MDA0903249.1 VWA domain-containing protein [Bacteroidota bacterium]MDA1242192.1 VWA domain-containing protein [Bacteroidota bacterium]